jgi:ArsR family metal-binding transcriptional regulator
MALIRIPHPDPESMMNRNRPVNALLKMQMEHLHAAEMKLPIGMQTSIYINAIKTEGEAAEYIQRVTEAIHEAHDAAEAKRSKPAFKPKRVISIAAVADERPVRKRTSAGKKKKDSDKRGRKK